jgi:hypothetical protein
MFILGNFFPRWNGLINAGGTAGSKSQIQRPPRKESRFFS